MLQMRSEAPFAEQRKLQIGDGILKQDRQCLSVQCIHIAQVAYLEAAKYFQKQHAKQCIHADHCPVSTPVIFYQHDVRIKRVPLPCKKSCLGCNKTHARPEHKNSFILIMLIFHCPYSFGVPQSFPIV